MPKLHEIRPHDLIAQARRFATEAHRRIDQRRKYSNQPYEVHLAAVADLVACVSQDPEMIAAAWLHDTVEDTPTTLADIEIAFGKAVARLVSDLTDVSQPGQGNRAARKQIDRQHTARASRRAKTIKLADLIDNCRDIGQADPGFAPVYLAEAAALLEVLTEGDKRLYLKAKAGLDRCAASLADGGQARRDGAERDLDDLKTPIHPKKGEPAVQKVKLDNNAFTYPMPMVLAGAMISGKANFMAVGWVSRVNYQPPLIGIALGRHHTNQGIDENRAFSVNIPDLALIEKTDYCGLVSGAKTDKSQVFDLFFGQLPGAPLIKQCPLAMACRLYDAKPLPTNTLYIGEIVEVFAEESCLTDGKPDIKKLNPFTLTMPDNRYWQVGECAGKAWSIGKQLKKG